MSETFSGWYFDGEDLQARAVTLTPVATGLQVHMEGHDRLVNEAVIRVSDRLGTLPRFLYLPGAHTIETADNDAVDAWLAGQQRGRLIALIHWLELRARVAAAATLILVASVVATIWWGLPVLARRAAMAVPDSIESQAGKVALATVDRFFGRSQLDQLDRARVEVLFDTFVREQDLTHRPRLEFRNMGGKFPNAFALPGGVIIMSDELVKLAEYDEEILAVFAHELGHIERRHALQSVLRGSAALLVVSTVTGDLSTLTSFSATIPFILLQRGYSREFEVEADDYAVAALRKSKIEPKFFASILKKLETARPAAGVDYSYLSTHPSTADRIRRIDPRGDYIAAIGKSPAPRAKPGSAKAKPLPLDSFGITDMARDLQPGDIRPRALVQTQPVYPTLMEQASIEGNVTVEFIIDRNGDVKSPVVVRSSHKEFEAAAVDAVTRWKFTPGQRRGRKINVRASQLIQFALDDLPAAAKPDPLSPKSFPARPPKP